MATKTKAQAERVDTGDLLAMICKAASERWPEDKSRPGVQIAHLPARTKLDPITRVPIVGLVVPVKAEWYVALHRYSAALGECRMVQFKTTHEDLDKALLEVARYVAPPQEERATLAKLLRASLLIVCLALLALVGCAGQVANAPDRCEAFDQCTTVQGASIACADGECACTSTHAGENRATVCKDTERQ